MSARVSILLASISILAATSAPSFAGRFGGGGFHGGGGMGGLGGFSGAMARPMGGFAGGAARPNINFGGGGFPGALARPGGGFAGGGALPGRNFGSGFGGAGPLPERAAGLSSIGDADRAVHGPYGGFSRSALSDTPARLGAQSPFATRPGEGGAGTRHVWDTPRGGTIYAGGDRGPFGGSGAYVYSGPRGAVVVGGGKGGSISGPGGGSISGGSAGHVVIGPNGNVNAGGSRGAKVVGPGGREITGGSHAGATVGPEGAEIHGSRGGIATGPGGTIAAGSHAAAAVGPYGAVATGGRFVAGRGAYGAGIAGTRFVAASDLQNQGAIVRRNFGYWNSFTPAWYVDHPGAWYAAGWAAGTVWNTCAWNDCIAYFGYPVDTAAVYYNYGDNVTYQDGSVYYDGQPYATEDEYAQQAADLAAQGEQADADNDAQWRPLGVFAMVKGDETTSSDIFQIALNADGVLRGNYYNATVDQTTPILGSLDKSSQRLAWRIQGDDDTTYETGLYNLTQDQTTMLVHFGKDRTEQYKLFRVQQNDSSQPNAPSQQQQQQQQ